MLIKGINMMKSIMVKRKIIKNIFALAVFIFLMLGFPRDYFAALPTTTDGTLRYQLLSEEDKTVQVGTGNDDTPSAVATGLYNKSATKIVIPDTITIGGESYRVTKISCYAFYRCTNLTEITIGKNIESIGVGAFKLCTKVNKLHWNAKNVNDFSYSNTTGSGNVFASLGESTEGVALDFSDEVERVPAYAFYTSSNNHQYCDQIKTISFGKNITEIGKYAFVGSKLLTSLALPAKLTEVSSYSFKDCVKLQNIIIPNQVQTIATKAFAGCEAIEELTIGENVTQIANDAFSGCRKLTFLNWNASNMPDLALGNGIFTGAGQDVGGLNVIFGAKVGHVPANLFYPKTSVMDSDKPLLCGITFNNGNTAFTIGDNAFRGCNQIDTLILPKSLTEIGSNAFYDCRKLKTLYWNAPNVSDFIQGNGVFENIGLDTTGTQVTFDASLTHVPTYAFAPNATSYGKNTNIKTIRAATGRGMISLGKNAFRNCQSITTFDWKNRLQIIDDYAFYGCKGMTQISLDANELEVGDYAFSQCSNVNLITLGNQLTDIGQMAFAGIGTSSSKATNVYQLSNRAITYGEHYNGSYVNVYCPIQVVSEHGSATFSGTKVSYAGKELYKTGQTLTLTVAPKRLQGDAWEVLRVTVNGEEIAGSNHVYRFVVPSSITELVVTYRELTADDFEAINGNQMYEKLADAIADASENTTIKLLKDISLDGAITINKSLTLDGCGYSIVRTRNAKGFVVTNGAAFSLKDVTVDGDGLMGCLLLIENGSADLLAGATLKNNVMTSEGTSAYGTSTVSVKEGSSFTLDGGCITKNSAPKGGAIYLAKSTSRLPGGVAQIRAGQIIENESTGSGGAIYVEDGASLSVYGGEITNNTSVLRGAGICLGAVNMTIGGTPSIVGNKRGVEEENIYISKDDGRIQIDGIGRGANIGVTTKTMPSITSLGGSTVYNDIQVTEGMAGSGIAAFYSDKVAAVAVLKDGEIYLTQPEYQITFDANGGEVLNGRSRVSSITYTLKGGANLYSQATALDPRKSEAPNAFYGWFDEEGNRLTQDSIATKDVTYTAKWLGGACTLPVISVANGTYNESKQVEITVSEGEFAYYTLDGSVPKEDGSNAFVYENGHPIEIDEDCTLKVIAVREDYVPSRVVSATYVIRKVTSVTIDNAPEKLRQGEEFTLNATVITGNQSTPKTLTWGLDETGKSYRAGTTISPEGKVSVDTNESETEVVIVATSTEDLEKTAVAHIRIVPAYAFSLYENTAIDDMNVTVTYHEEGEEIILPSMERTGFTFLGWSTTRDGVLGQTYQAGQSYTMGSGPASLYALWVENQVTGITVHLADHPDQEISAYTIDCEENISFAATLTGTGSYSTKVNYSVIGSGLSSGTTVNTSGRLSIASDEKKTNFTLRVASTENATIYKDIAITVRYHVTYHYGYTVDGATTKKEYMSATRSMVFSSIGERTGYTFYGWSVGSDSGEELYAPGAIYAGGTGNLDVYAIWQKDQILGVDILNTRGDAISSMTGSCGASYQLSANVRGSGTYDTNVNWSIAGNDAQATSVTSEGLVTISALESTDEIIVTATAARDASIKTTLRIVIQYEACTVTYNNNETQTKKQMGRDPQITGTVLATEGFMNHGVTLADCEYTSVWCDFVQWNTKADGTGQVYIPGQNITLTQDTTLYAIWREKPGIVTSVAITRYGSNLALTSDSLMKGLESTYDVLVEGVNQYDPSVVWTIEDNNSFSTTITQDGVLSVDEHETSDEISIIATSVNTPTVFGSVTIHLVAPEYYTITYIANIDGATGEMPAVNIVKTKNFNVAANAFTKSGYTFRGWALSSSGNTAIYQPGTELQASRNITFYAVWRANGSQPTPTPTPTPVPGQQPSSTGAGTGGNTSGGGSSQALAPQVNLPAVGTTITDTKSSGMYQVVSAQGSCEVVYTKQLGQGAKVVIPDQIIYDGVACDVVGIGASAFAKNKKLASVTIGNKVRTIGAKAFSGCVKLKSVAVGMSVLEIGKQAFNGCSSLKKINIKSPVLKKVGAKAFKGIHPKAVIKIPKSQKKTYEKVLKKKGQSAGVKIK